MARRDRRPRRSRRPGRMLRSVRFFRVLILSTALLPRATRPLGVVGEARPSPPPAEDRGSFILCSSAATIAPDILTPLAAETYPSRAQTDVSIPMRGMCAQTDGQTDGTTLLKNDHTLLEAYCRNSTNAQIWSFRLFDKGFPSAENKISERCLYTTGNLVEVMV